MIIHAHYMIKSLLLCLLLSVPLCASAQSQGEMNDDANKKFEQADRELNAVYQQILREYKSDPTFITRMKAAQRLWIQWRDAEMKAIFPAKDERLEYGSVFPMCYSVQLTDLTKERTKKLRVWIEGIPEGDVCGGSVRTR